MSTETASDDDNFGTEHSHKVYKLFYLNIYLTSKLYLFKLYIYIFFFLRLLLVLWEQKDVTEY